MRNDLTRFAEAHGRDYPTALAEIRRGRKESHWMWYIFPQLQGLGRSSYAAHYGIRDLEEARAFLEDEYLGANLKEISAALLQLDCDDARSVMGSPDDLKLWSSMTLFALADPKEPVFTRVLEKFFRGEMDEKTLRMLGVGNERP
ncbi:MAG: DUF1810 domain-containing protein [Candidatus Excrementavichristensenella sp.]|jgi:uncharacterized protein (DUF1810 family)